MNKRWKIKKKFLFYSHRGLKIIEILSKFYKNYIVLIFDREVCTFSRAKQVD